MDFSFITDETLRAQAEENYNKEFTTALETTVNTRVEEAVKSQIATAVKTQVEVLTKGLKSKNEELLAEKKAVQSKLQEFIDIEDPEKAKEALRFLSESTEAQMIKDGRIDELIQMKTATFRAEIDEKIKTLEGKATESVSLANTYKSKYEKKIIDDNLRSAALKAGILPAAIDDVLLRGGNVFSYTDGNIVALDKDNNPIKIGDDVLTTDKWVNSLKEAAPHYWPASQGANLGGPGIGAGAESAGDIQERLNELAKKGDMVGYRALRKKMQGKK